MTIDGDPRQQRWIVHLWLIIMFLMSLLVLLLQTSILVHIFLGLLFAGLVLAHLRQRRRTVASLWRDLRRVTSWLRPRGRLAWADLLLLLVTLNVIASGFGDYFSSGSGVMIHLGFMRPFRWHSVSAIALLILLLVHVIRRASRLRTSAVR
jgi:hypothetical protein